MLHSNGTELDALMILPIPLHPVAIIIHVPSSQPAQNEACIQMYVLARNSIWLLTKQANIRLAFICVPT